MQAQRELLQRELDIERRALRREPKRERDELLAIYTKRGIDVGVASELVDQVMQDPSWLSRPTPARSSASTLTSSAAPCRLRCRRSSRSPLAPSCH